MVNSFSTSTNSMSDSNIDDSIDVTVDGVLDVVVDTLVVPSTCLNDTDTVASTVTETSS